MITMDADLQDAPDEIPELYKRITEENFDLVSGWKKYATTLKYVRTSLQNYSTEPLEKHLGYN